MFPSKFPLLPFAQLVTVSTIVIIGLLVTANPLFVLALWFAWGAPPFVPRNMGEQDEQETEYSTHNVGFLAGGQPNVGDEE
jgi:hypothetical protein